jgi:hypothetical protein
MRAAHLLCTSARYEHAAAMCTLHNKHPADLIHTCFCFKLQFFAQLHSQPAWIRKAFNDVLYRLPRVVEICWFFENKVRATTNNNKRRHTHHTHTHAHAHTRKHTHTQSHYTHTRAHRTRTNTRNLAISYKNCIISFLYAQETDWALNTAAEFNAFRDGLANLRANIG